MFGLGCLVSVGMRNGSVKRSRGGLEPINQAKLGGLAVVKLALSISPEC